MPLFSQPAQGLVKIDFRLAADQHVVGESAKSVESWLGGASAGEDDDGRESLSEDGGVWIDAARTTDNDSKAVFTEAVLDADFLEALTAGAEENLVEIECARACHDCVRGGAQFVEVIEVALAAEGGDGAIGGGDFAVGSHRHVEEDEGA